MSAVDKTPAPRSGVKLGTDNAMPETISRVGVEEMPLSDGPNKRENGTLGPAAYKLDSGNVRIDR